MLPRWLDPSQGADFDRQARALGPEIRERLLAAADRLADTSALLAARCCHQAPAAWTRFGAEGFDRWVGLGEELARGAPDCPPAGIVFFDTPPARFGSGGLETAALWCAVASEVACSASRHLAVTFLGASAELLSRSDAALRLRAAAATGLWLHGRHGWRGAFLAEAFFGAGRPALEALAPSCYRRWAELGMALAAVRREREFFATLPTGLGTWTEQEQADFLAHVLALAAVAPEHALVFYRELPPALASLAPATRSQLLDVLAAMDATLAPTLAGLAPLAGALVLAVPEAERAAGLALVRDLATRAPSCAAAALRTLARVYEEARPNAVPRWFEAGARVAAESAQAGRAFFALESATGLRLLRAGSTAATLAESEGVWRKFARMLGGEGVAVRGVAEVSLRPALDPAPEEPRIALPERIDLLPTFEENLRLYRLLAAAALGRRLFGTYDDASVMAELHRPDESALLEDVFLVAEGARIQHRLAAAYAGLAADGRWAGRRLLAHWSRGTPPGLHAVLDGLLAVVLADDALGRLPVWLPEDAARAVVRLLAPLRSPRATGRDSLIAARALLAMLTTPVGRVLPADAGPHAVEGLTILTDAGDDPSLAAAAADASASTTDDEDVARERLGLELGPAADVDAAGGRSLSLDELRRLLAAGATITQGAGAADDGPGLPITDLLGKLPAPERDALRRLLRTATGSGRRRREPPDAAEDGAVFHYDEWDDGIGDYRPRWCRLREVDLAPDGGEYFHRTLGTYADLIPRVRREFERLRPEMYRTIHGLEDGEDFDLNAVIDARTEARARRPPSIKLYRSRLRETRDVATLFLLDMSASTDEPLDRTGRRIIDVTKEALVVMAEALDALGDAYAIYGFSGEGRGHVEFYTVKGFQEPLATAVKGRIGGIVPRRSTRMGTALRHALTKLASVSARSKHLLLLSDGFPQDIDYGEDRRSHTYGIRDTAVALREVEAARVTPFCVTVDRAGHDYLRAMCDSSRYLIIEDVAALPRELPKIYQRVVQPRAGTSRAQGAAERSASVAGRSGVRTAASSRRP